MHQRLYLHVHLLTVKAKGDGTTRANTFGPESGALSVNLPCNPKVTVSAVSATITEGTAVQFTFTASPAPLLSNDTITVGFSHTTTGDFLTGSVPSSHQFTGTSGTSTLQLPTTNDKKCEANGSVGITITSVSFSSSASSSDDVKAASYGIGTPKSATVTILDNDCPTPTPVPGPGPAPSGLSAKAKCDGVHLHWPPATGSVTGYEIQRRANVTGAKFKTITTLGPSTTSYVDTIPTPGLLLLEDATDVKKGGTPYWYRIRANTGRTPGAWLKEIEASHKPIRDEWGVLEYMCMPVDWTVPASKWSKNDRYIIDIEANTGFQINEIKPAATPDPKVCDWGSNPSLSTGWVASGTRFHLVRCKLGTGAANITIQKKIGGGGPGTILPVATVGPVPQSWHRIDHHVSYKIALSPLYGKRPVSLPVYPPGDPRGPSYTPDITKAKTAIKTAADIWSGKHKKHDIWLGKTAPVSFDEVSASPDVIVKGYWNNSANDVCQESIACVLNKDENDKPTGDYPHLETQTLWIEFPPQFPNDPDLGEQDSRRWTNSLGIAGRANSRFYYLPHVLMHEFGHTAGLGHTIFGQVMGPVVRGYPLETPMSDDADGMRYTYASHTKNHP